MRYEDALQYIHQLNKFGMRLGLERIEYLLKALGNPHEGFRSVHIAGTNGKGSTAAMISSILIESGHKTGLFTSPYLERFTERIRINNREIPEEQVALFISKVIPIIDEMKKKGFENPTEFEVVTAMGFDYFSRENIDVGVIEVGLGGRLDSTNVITPVTSVITPISFDHTSELGNTLRRIAGEKAGIIKEAGTTVSAPQHEEAYRIIEETCIKKGNTLFVVGKDIMYELKDYSFYGSTFDLKGIIGEYKNLKLPLAGKYQIINASTAVGAVETLIMKGINIDEEAIFKGLEKTRWPGRLEMISQMPRILLDAAHNLSGIRTLREAIEHDLEYDKLILVIGILKDKDYKGMLEMIIPLADIVIATKPDSPRALDTETLVKEISGYGVEVYKEDSIENAVKTACSMAGLRDLVCFTGSIYMIGRVRTIIINKGITAGNSKKP